MQLLIHVQTCTQMLVIICAIYENNLSRNGTIKNYNSWLTVHWLYLFKCFPDVVFLRSSLVEVDGHGILSGVHLRLQTHWGTKYEWTTKSHTVLTHWGRVTHICVAKLTITGSDTRGGALTIWRLLHMLRHFDPPFSGLLKICIVSTPIF